MNSGNNPSLSDRLLEDVRRELSRRKAAPVALANAEPAYQLGQTLLFKKNGTSLLKNVQGFSHPEETHRWTDGSSAGFDIRLAEPVSDSLILALQVAPFRPQGRDPQDLTLTVNGVLTAHWVVEREGDYSALLLPIATSGRTSLRFSFQIPHAISPRAAGLSPDSRCLGIAFRSLTITLDPIHRR